jgi:hypothetical protein
VLSLWGIHTKNCGEKILTKIKFYYLLFSFILSFNLIQKRILLGFREREREREREKKSHFFFALLFSLHKPKIEK